LPQRLNKGFFTIIPAGILTIASISKFCNNDLLQQHGTEEEDKASHNPDILIFSGTGISDESHEHCLYRVVLYIARQPSVEM
jgi:hypothetical protein